MKMTKHIANLKQQSGFTLIEMMIVVAIIAIIATIAIPSFNTTLSNYQLRKGTTDIVAAFNQARSEASLSGRASAVTFDAATRTFIIQYSEPIRAGTPITTTQYTLNERLQITPENMANPLVILPTGKLSTPFAAGADKIVFRICDKSINGEKGYTIWVNSLGMTQAAIGPQTFTPASTVASAACV